MEPDCWLWGVDDGATCSPTSCEDDEGQFREFTKDYVERDRGNQGISAQNQTDGSAAGVALMKEQLSNNNNEAVRGGF